MATLAASIRKEFGILGTAGRLLGKHPLSGFKNNVQSMIQLGNYFRISK
jgi:hypothetical protein